VSSLRVLWLHLAAAGGRGIRRSLLFGLAVTIVLWGGLAMRSIVQLADARDMRARETTPRVADTPKQSHGYFLVRELRTEEGSAHIVLLNVDDPSVWLPSGLSRPPAPGEMFVSPALVPATAQGALGFSVAGVLRPQDLVGPNQAIAYVGMERDDLARIGHPLAGFGVRDAADAGVDSGANPLPRAFALGVVAMSLIAFIYVLPRLSLRRRIKETAALRLLGLSKRRAQVVAAFDVSVGTALGGAGALVLLDLTRSPLAHGIAGFEGYPSDIGVSLHTVVFVVLVLPGMVVAGSAAAFRSAVRNPLGARLGAPAPRPGGWRVALLVIGLGVLVGLVIARATESSATLLVVGIFISIVGLILGLSPLVLFITDRVLATTESTPLRLAARRLEFDPGTPMRITVGLVLLIFVFGFMAGLLRDEDASAMPIGDYEEYRIQAADLAPALVRDQVLRLPDVSGTAVKLQSVVTPPPLNVTPPPSSLGVVALFASCLDLRIMTDSPVESCRDGDSYRLLPSDGPQVGFVPEPGSSIRFSRASAGRALVLKSPVESISLSRQALGDLGADVIYPKSALPGTIPRTAEITLLSVANTASESSISRAIFRLAPGAKVDFVNSNAALSDQIDFDQELVTTATEVASVIALITFLVAISDQIVVDQRNVASLRVLGVPVRVVRAAEGWYAALPLLVGIPLSVMIAQLVEQATVQVGGNTSSWSPTGLVITTLLGVLFLSSAVGLAVSWTNKTSLTAELIRRE
jgi:hypothetical protein